MHDLARRIIFALIFLVPIFYLFNNRISSLVFDILFLAAGGLTMVVQGREQNLPTYRITSLLSLVCIYLIFQVTPLHPTWLKLLTPVTWQSYQSTILAIVPDVWLPISVHAHATVYALLHITAIGCYCLGVVRLPKNRQDLNKMFSLLAIVVSTWALLCAGCSLTIIVNPVWLTPWATHISMLRELLLLQGIPFLPILWAAHAAMKPKTVKITLKIQLRDFMRSPQAFPHIGLSIAILLMITSAFLSIVPSAIAAVIIGWVTYQSIRFCKNLDNQSTRRALSGMTVLFSFTLLLAFSLRFTNQLWPRISRDAPTLTDLPLWLFSWFGSGAGTHGDLYGHTMINQAVEWSGSGHGPLVDIWLGFGVVGVILLILSVSAFWFAGREQTPLRHDSRSANNYLAAGVSSLVVMVAYYGTNSAGSWLAFIATLYLIVAIVANARRLARGETTRTNADESRGYSRLLTVGGGFLTFALLGACLLLHAVPVANIWLFGNDRIGTGSVSLGGDSFANTEPWLPKLEKWTLLDNELPSSLGQLRFIQHRDNEARQLFMKALKRRPLSATSVVNLAGVLACLGDVEHSGQLIKSETINRYRPDEFTEHLVIRLLDLPEYELTIDFIHSIFSSRPEQAGRYMVLMELAGWSHSEIRETLTTEPEVWLEFGYFLLNRELTEEAEEIFFATAQMCSSVTCPDEEIILKVADYFIDKRQYTKALFIVSEGKKSFPSSPGLRIMTTDLHALLGHNSRAMGMSDNALN